MLKNADNLSKYLMGWIGSVARGFKKDSLLIRKDGTTASNVLVKLAEGTGFPVTVLEIGSEEAAPLNALLLGSATRDNYETVRFGDRRGGVDADALPLATLHESEVTALAASLGVELGTVAEPLPNVAAEDVEAALSLIGALYGQTKGDMFIHLATTLKKHSIGSEEFYNTLVAIGDNEILTRYRHNPNIPVANVRQPGMDFVA